MKKFIYFNLFNMLVFFLGQNLIAVCPEGLHARYLGVFKKYPSRGESLTKITKRAFFISTELIFRSL